MAAALLLAAMYTPAPRRSERRAHQRKPGRGLSGRRGTVCLRQAQDGEKLNRAGE